MKAERRAALVSRYVEGLSGTVTTVLEHAQRLSARGWAVDVYAQYMDAEAVRAAGAVPRKIAGWPWGSWLKRRWFAARADRATARGYDLVHGHGDNFAQDVLSLHNCVHAAHEAVHGRPLPEESAMARVHGLQLRERRFKRLIANSRLMKDDVVRRFAVPDDLVDVVYPGHDPKRFSRAERAGPRAETRRALGLSDSDVVFGLITSGDFVKRGVEVFLLALGRAARSFGKGFKALVVGKEARLGPYLRRAGAEGLDGVVRFLPPSPQVENFYHALDVYVHPAHFEEFGQSVQEALACGLPVLTSKRVGASELMIGEAREYLLERPQPQPLAEQMAALAQDAALRRRLAELGPQAAAANTWDRNFEATLAVYEKVLQKS